MHVEDTPCVGVGKDPVKTYSTDDDDASFEGF